MSMQDLLWTFSEDQPVSASGDTDCTDIIDIVGSAGIGASARTKPKIGGGTPLWCNVVVDTTFTSAGSGELAAKLEHGSTSAIGTTLVAGPAISGTASAGTTPLVPGKVLLSVPIPPECERYIGVVYTVTTAVFSAGKVNAWIGTSPIYDP